MVKTGYVAESLNMTVTPAEREVGVDPITATIDRDTFVAEVTSSGTVTLTYTTDWSADPATYGITVTGTPISGDEITVVYVKENRGTIIAAEPTSFVSTGWNLYNHTAGYARVYKYSEEYGFKISGTYTTLKFAPTLTGDQVTINPDEGAFDLPDGATDGYLFVTGGNATNTAIWMTWSDWTETANGGTFKAYSETSIDLTGVMVSFPAGLCRIGNVFDEINLNTLQAISRIEQMEYTEENLASVIASGVAYDTDSDYIYAERTTPVVTSISLSNQYTVSDHGLEMFNGTSVPLTASSLYGQDLKGKLMRDVLTVSQQTLTDAQKKQVRNNLKYVEDITSYCNPTSSNNKLDVSTFTAFRTGNLIIGAISLVANQTVPDKTSTQVNLGVSSSHPEILCLNYSDVGFGVDDQRCKIYWIDTIGNDVAISVRTTVELTDNSYVMFNFVYICDG